ncbi:MAG: hypothetical protein Q8L78_07450 [Coxiellaceae bacterium]|nr:hypothetical protein [Coxiellaceae bacterium]
MPTHIKITGNYVVYISGTYRGNHRPRKHPAHNPFSDLTNNIPCDPLSPEKRAENYNALINREKVPGAVLATSPKKATTPPSAKIPPEKKSAERTPEPTTSEPLTWSAKLFPKKPSENLAKNMPATLKSSIR